MSSEHPAALLEAVVADDPARPVVTFYDDATGERTELSGATLSNWVAKTANLLIDGAGLGPGDPVAVLLPAHWQTAAVLLGCWAAGVAVARTDPTPVDVAFVARDRLEEATAWSPGETYGLALAPLAAPMRDAPAGVADYVIEVRTFGDRFAPATPVDPDGPALDGLSFREVVERARQRAREIGLEARGRLLAVDPVDPVDWLVAPLAVGGSVVLSVNTDRAKLSDRAASERVTVTL